MFQKQQFYLTVSDWRKLRQQTRLHGEKPTTFLAMPPTDGNCFGDEAPELLRYSAVYLHHSRILLGVLFNIRQNGEILGVKESVLSLDELRRIQNRGYRQTAAAACTGELRLVRYGEANDGIVAAVNFHPLPKREILTVDTEYFGKTPLLAVNGHALTVQGASTQLPEIAPLSFLAVDMPAALPGSGREIEYVSSLKRDLDRTRWEIRFTRECDLSGLEISGAWRLKNFPQIPARAEKEMTLVFEQHDPKWKTSAA